MHIGERGTRFTSLGSPRNALSFRINTFDRGDGYYGRGYVLAALDTSEFKYSTSASGITAPQLLLDFMDSFIMVELFIMGQLAHQVLLILKLVDRLETCTLVQYNYSKNVG